MLPASFPHPGPVHVHFEHSYTDGIKSAVRMIQVQMITFPKVPWEGKYVTMTSFQIPQVSSTAW